MCSYRVLASYESPLLEDFSKCILQKHNCLRNSAAIPDTPDPPPLAAFRGVPLTHDAAEDLFIGHLAPQAATPQPFSWRVACGKNPGTHRPPLPCASCGHYPNNCAPPAHHAWRVPPRPPLTPNPLPPASTTAVCPLLQL